jgi:hypothetical protein
MEQSVNNWYRDEYRTPKTIEHSPFPPYIRLYGADKKCRSRSTLFTFWFICIFQTKKRKVQILIRLICINTGHICVNMRIYGVNGYLLSLLILLKFEHIILWVKGIRRLAETASNIVEHLTFNFEPVYQKNNIGGQLHKISIIISLIIFY